MPNDPILWTPAEIGIGVDFGMTYTGAALVFPAPNGRLILEIVPTSEESSAKKFPTVVFVSNDRNTIAVGKNAKKELGSGRVYELFKQWLGTGWRDRAGIVPDATFLATQVLRVVKGNIDEALRQRGWLQNDTIKKRYVFSYPGTWSEAAKLAYGDAIKDAGFPMADVALVDEAVATAIAIVGDGNHPEIQNGNKPIFICDFGGGTTDFALVRAAKAKDGFVYMAHPVDGHPTLGMSNLDKLIALLVAQNARLLQPSGQSVFTNHTVCGVGLDTAWIDFDVNAGWKSVLLAASEQCKVTAFEQWFTFTSISVGMRDGRNQFVAKQEVQPLVSTMLQTLTSAAQRYLNEIGQQNRIHVEDIGFIAIGGGGSALPDIAAKLKLLMPTAEVLNIQPDIATSLVQRGAAYHAFNPHAFTRLAAKSYGIKTFFPDKPQGRIVPASETRSGPDKLGNRIDYYPYYQRFINRGDGIKAAPIKYTFLPISTDTLITIQVLCGESDNPLVNEEIGTLDLTLRPPPGQNILEYPITCEFTINSMCLLHVDVKGPNGEHIESTFKHRIDLLP